MPASSKKVRKKQRKKKRQRINSDVDSQDDGDYLDPAVCLPIDPISAKNLSLKAVDPSSYLSSVKAEADLLPTVFSNSGRIKSDIPTQTTTTSLKSTRSLSETVGFKEELDKSREHSFSSEWLQEFKDIYPSLQSKFSSSKPIYDWPVKRLIVSEIEPIIKAERPDLLFTPSVSRLKGLPYDTFISMISWAPRWVKADMKEPTAQWLFAMMLCIDPLQTSGPISFLRILCKRCIRLRNTACLPTHVRAICDMIIAVVTINFGQLDLAISV